MKRILLLSITLFFSLSSVWAFNYTVNTTTFGNPYYVAPADQANTSGPLGDAIYVARELGTIDTIFFASDLSINANNAMQLNKAGANGLVVIGAMPDLTPVNVTISGSNQLFQIGANDVEIRNLNFSGATQPIIVEGSSDGTIVSDISITGANQAIQVQGSATNTTIENVQITSPQIGVKVNGTSNVNISDVTVTNPSNVGIQVEGGANDVTINTASILNSNQYGIQFNNFSGSNATVSDVEIANSGEEGILVTGNNHSGLSINDSYVYGSGKSGVLIENGEAVEIENSVFGLDKAGVQSANGTDQQLTGWIGVGVTVAMEYAGIFIRNTDGFTVSGNVTSGNTGHGIKVENNSFQVSVTPSVISNNKIGVNSTGDQVIGNFGDGIYLDNGREISVLNNHIAGNGNSEVASAGDQMHTQNFYGNGIHVSKGTGDNIIQGNFIGTNADGSASVVGSVDYGNDVTGVYIHGSSSNLIGGNQVSQRNVVGGNGYGFQDVFTQDADGQGSFYFGRRHGVQLHDDGGASSNNTVSGNLIGVSTDLVTTIPNAEDQVSILGWGSGSRDNTIGGTSKAEANIIGGGNFGVAIQGPNAVNNNIYNNLIGVTDFNGTGSIALAPLEAGIKIQNSSNGTDIGGVGLENYVSNTNNAIEVFGDATGNNISSNIMTCNTGAGISLSSNGNTEYGTLGDLVKNTAESRTNTISGISPASGDRIDIYIADDCNGADACGVNRQGKTYITSVTSSVDNVYGKGGGYWEYVLTASDITAGLTPTNAIVTATDGSDNTSEFSTCEDLVSCEAPTSVVLDRPLLYELCENEDAVVSYVVTFPNAIEEAKTHVYNLYKSPDYTTPIQTNGTGDAFTVADSGFYRVEVYNPESQSACGLISSDSVEVKLGKIANTGDVQIVTPGDICANGQSPDQVYKVTPSITPSTEVRFNWWVTGSGSGLINGSATRDSVVVTHGDTGVDTIWVREEYVFAGSPTSKVCSDPTPTFTVVTVNPVPTPTITDVTTSQCEGDTITYTANGLTGSTFVWTLVGGTEIASVGNTIDVVWASGPSGTISVIETSLTGCTGNASESVSINRLPDDVVLLNTDAVCLNETFTAAINNGNGGDYTWEITGGTPTSFTGSDLLLDITSDGSATDSIRINITPTSTAGCAAQAPTYFAVGLNPLPIPADLTPLESCAGDTLTVAAVANTGATPTWSSVPTDYLVNNMVGGFNPNQASFRLAIDGDAVLTYSETYDATGCTTPLASVKTLAITENSIPLPVLDGLTDVQCADSVNAVTYTVTNPTLGAQYTWFYDNVKTATSAEGVIGTNTTSDITYGILAYKVKVVETSAKGCVSDTVELAANVVGCVFNPNFNLSAGGTDICFDANGGVDFTNTSQGVTATTVYNWTFDVNGSNATPATSTDMDPTGIVYAMPGVYTVRLVISDNIQGVDLLDSIDIDITIKALPAAPSIVGVTAVCDNGMEWYNIVAPGSYTWGVTTGGTKTIEKSDSLFVTFADASNSPVSVWAVETDNGCLGDTAKVDVVINEIPAVGVINRVDAGTDCQFETMNLEYVGVGADAVVWALIGSDATLISTGKLTADLTMGSTAGIVTAYPISAEGCFDGSTATFDFTPVLAPDASLAFIDGPDKLCEGASAQYEVLSSESTTDITYSWDQLAHTITSDLTQKEVSVTPNLTSGPIQVTLSRGACTSSPIFKNIDKVERPSIPALTYPMSTVCEQTEHDITYSSVDTLRYSWSMSPTGSSDILTASSGIDLDSIHFYINDRSQWPLDCSPMLVASLQIDYQDAELSECYSETSVTIPVDFRLGRDTLSYDQANGANVQVSIENLDGHPYNFICNSFDYRWDSIGNVRAIQCGASLANLEFEWYAWELKDTLGTGVLDSLESGYLMNSTTDSVNTVEYHRADFSKNVNHYFVFQYLVNSTVCEGDTALSITDTVTFLESNPVDYKLYQDLEACFGDSLIIEVLNYRDTIVGERDDYANYHWVTTMGDTISSDFTGVITGFTQGFDIFGDTAYYAIIEDGFEFKDFGDFVNDTVYVTNSLGDTIDYVLTRQHTIEGKHGVYEMGPEYYPYPAAYTSLDAVRHTLDNDNLLGYDYYVYPSITSYNDTITVRAVPEYCAIINSKWDPVLTDTLAVQVVSQPGSDSMLVGIDLATTDWQGNDLDDIQELADRKVWDELNMSQLQDKFALYDDLYGKRDTAAVGEDKYYFPKGKSSVEYRWGWRDGDSLTIAGLLTDYDDPAVVPRVIGTPEYVDYVLQTFHYSSFPGRTTDTVCISRDSIRVTFDYVPWIPNAFSPNNDGSYDVWEIENIAKYPNNKVQIFNRWGSLLLTIDGYNNESNFWDGTIDGEEVVTGTYFYLVDFGDEVGEKTGAVSIVR